MLVVPLPIEFTSGNSREVIYPVLLDLDNQKLLVDCGYPCFLPLLQDALERTGYALTDLTGIIITHHDLDHVGALYELVQQCSDLKIYSSPIEKQFINGQCKAPRLVQAEQLYNDLPETMKQFASQFQHDLEAIRPVSVYGVLEEGCKVFDEIEVISTPGHTPGHISLYLPSTRTLIAGDALVYADDKLGIANPEFTLDLAEALQSVQKIGNLDIDQLICYHGGVVEAPANLIFDLLSNYHVGK